MILLVTRKYLILMKWKLVKKDLVHNHDDQPEKF